MNVTKIMKKLAIFFLILTVLFITGRAAIKKFAGEDALNILYGLALQAVGKEAPDYAISTEFFTPMEAEIQLDESIKPFREIGESLGESAKGNNFVTFRGATIFDANGDGRMDLYLAHSGRPLSRKNDENNVLQPNERVDAKPSMLYLNMGNDENGDPIYKSVPDLIKAKNNGKNVEAELLTENKYIPRKGVAENPFGVGRIAFGACSADFNGDGKVDLLVLNHHFGMPHVDLEHGLKIFPPSENVGRKKSEVKYIHTALPPYLAGDIEDGMNNTVNYGGKEEGEGRNTLYLNLGDQDKDGIPEWKDATEEAGMHLTNWASASASVGDIDRDGDLDIYVCNFIDPDFWGFGRRDFGGHPNELWINQLAETGKLTFKEQALEMGVAGLHEEENLPSSMWDEVNEKEVDNSEHIFNGKQVGKKADHSWSSQFIDFNSDGYPDLVVANDVGNRLRVYENQQGKGFKIDEKFHDLSWNGAWMGIASGDLDGDLNEEIMLSNFGTQSATMRNTAVFADDPSEVNIASTMTRNYMYGKARTHHTVLSTDPKEGLKDITADIHVQHSPYIAPDITIKSNAAKEAAEMYEKYHYQDGIAALEFAWNQVLFDVENDGDLDMYSVGSLSRGNDDFLGEMTSSPGRLLVNETENGDLSFVDKTLEYQVLDIAHMDYTSNPPRRKSPGTGWHKRDYVYLQDLDSYAEMGLEASQKSRIKDLFRLHESACGVINADLNDDGFQDMVVCHAGGNNSNWPSARNLNVEVMGKVMAMPPPNKVIKAPTNNEDGPTFMYINSGAPEGQQANWVKITLKDPTTSNTFGVGARLIANGKVLRRFTIGGQSYSSIHAPIHIGLGGESLTKLEIQWGSGDDETQVVTFDEGIVNQHITVTRRVTL